MSWAPLVLTAVAVQFNIASVWTAMFTCGLRAGSVNGVYCTTATGTVAGAARAPTMQKARRSISGPPVSTRSRTRVMSLRLVYFDGQARAEISRLMLAFGGIDYEDVRVKFVRAALPWRGARDPDRGAGGLRARSPLAPLAHPSARLP